MEAAAALGRGTLGAARRVTKMVLFRLLGRSDYERWGDPSSLETWWESRTQKLAALIPAGTRVIEFGAGRRRLASFLDPRCSYVASDLVERGPDTFVCDLNRRPLPDLAPLAPEVAVFAGVLEYLREVPEVVEWLSAQVRYCVASYAVAQRLGLRGALVAGARRSYWRAYHGYMNSYSEAELLAIFARNGFACLRTESWNEQRLFLFERRRGEGAP
jgi:hypothetical protein